MTERPADLPAIVPWPRRPEPAPPGALVFDLDGTLVDTVRLRVEGWMEAFGALGDTHRSGRSPPPDRRGRSRGRAGRRARRRAGDRRCDGGAPGPPGGEAFGRLNRAPRPLPGATDLLAALAASGIPHAIATASRAGQVLASVDALGLESARPSWTAATSGTRNQRPICSCSRRGGSMPIPGTAGTSATRPGTCRRRARGA